MGINNGLRAGDLLRLRVKDVKHLKEGGSIVIKKSKTDKENTRTLSRINEKLSPSH